jgi:hypothetical protein
MRMCVGSCAMRTPIALAALAACTLAGCTVIPPADPSRMQGSYTPQYPSAPSQAPQQPVQQPPAPMPGPAPVPVYTPVPDYTPPPVEQGPSLTYAALGQTVTVDGPRITPLEVLEDSRCPMNARCVWAGQLRLRVRIESGTGGTVELTSGKPVNVADGTLELVEVRPDKVAGSANGTVKPADYRFGLRFMGGY